MYVVVAKRASGKRASSSGRQPHVLNTSQWREVKNAARLFSATARTAAAHSLYRSLLAQRRAGSKINSFYKSAEANSGWSELQSSVRARGVIKFYILMKHTTSAGGGTE
jgi:hypothetical protein